MCVGGALGDVQLGGRRKAKDVDSGDGNLYVCVKVIFHGWKLDIKEVEGFIDIYEVSRLWLYIVFTCVF